MSKTTIKVYFNNGCTTLLYNEQTTVEDIIRVVIKGRLSLNELRYKQCFQLRSTRFSLPTKDFDPLFSPTSNVSSNSPHLPTQSSSSSLSPNAPTVSSSSSLPTIEDFFWLRNDLRIVSWMEAIKSNEKHNDIDFWKLQLRVRLISSDLNEVKFKDPVTFNYYYEQIKNDFLLYVSPSIHDVNLVQNLLELGCLEMRRAFQTMNPSILDKKINYDYLEKDVGLKRFFPDLVLQQKAKNIKKMIIKGMKTYENLNEAECMLKYLEKLKYLWKYNEESFKCFLGLTWSVPITVVINYDQAISWFTNQREPIQNTKFDKIRLIITELDENQRDGLLKLKIADAKEMLNFKFESLREAENMASLINGYCFLVNKTGGESVWTKSPLSPLKKPSQSNLVTLESTANRSSRNSDQEVKTPKKLIDSLTNLDDVMFRSPALNSVHILSEHDDSAMFDSSTLKVDTPLKKRQRHAEISKDALSCHERLGSGQFGDVYRGLYRNNTNQTIEVAIKKFKINHEETLDATEVALIAKKFMKEARIMEQFDHPHIIKLVGVCSDGPLQIVMELAKFGQLRTYLQANKDEIETTTLIYYCYQLNTAMEYLESKKFVHRDIAARNVLVVNHECVKLADFGLSRQIDDNIYLATKCKLPIKWMAPESINFRKFTSLSDVWMFGVCIWEILSFGEKPFQGIKNPDVIKLIEDKQRLACPKNCPEELYFLMLKCWEYDSAMRPKFTELRYAINAIYTSYKENKTRSAIIPPSSSNGSSFFSTSSNSSSSVSSALINPNNSGHNGVTIGESSESPLRNKLIANELLKSVMAISRSSSGAASKTSSTGTSKNSVSPESLPGLSDHSDASTPPPPKPNRNNNSANGSMNGNSSSALTDCSTTTLTPSTSIIKRTYIPPFKSNLTASFDLQNQQSKATPTGHLASPDGGPKSDFKYLDKDIAYVDEDELARTSKSIDNLWLNEKLKEMGLEKSEPPRRNSNQNEVSFASTHSNSSTPASETAMKDILLRDQTLHFIQTISVFIRCLNSVQNIRDIDNELAHIRNALGQLVETIKTLDNLDYHQSKRIHEKLSDLEKLLLKLIQELKVNRLENVINTSLELARTANELFHTITRLPNSPVRKT